MFYSDGFLHAVVDEEGLLDPSGGIEVGFSSEGREGNVKDDVVVEYDVSEATANAVDSQSNEKLSRRQQKKVNRKLKKQQAKESKRQLNSEVTEDKNTPPQAPLRLHQYVSTVFRSELNVAENGAGYFIKNAPKVSAHHAILKGVVQLNNKVCRQGRTILKYGDIVSLQIEPEESRKGSDLVSWQGSKDVAKRLEGDVDGEERRGRMGSSGHSDDTIHKEDLSNYEMIKYYREKLGHAWNSEVHEPAIMKPLPLTLRVLKPSAMLSKELKSLGFSPVTEEDFVLQLSSLDADEEGPKKLASSLIHELVDNTWVARDSLKSGTNEKELGVFLSEARVSGEIRQQELLWTKYLQHSQM